jgi:1-acyl-sn-glycerol-3-phosphate acyltransferase
MIPRFHWWRTVFFLIPAITVYTIAFGTLSLGSSLFERSGYFAHWCARMWSRLILATTGVRVSAQGMDRLEPGRTYVFVANHQSIYDIPILFWSLPYQLRIIAKESLGNIPFLGWHLRRTGHMLVDRRHPDPTRIFGWAARLTSNGLSLIVFPEGTRSRDGRVARFKGGSFYLALEAGLPVVPLSVVGSRHVMLKGRLTTYPGEVRLIVHEPIDTRGLVRSDAKAFGERVRRIIAPDAEADLGAEPPDVDAVHARA